MRVSVACTLLPALVAAEKLSAPATSSAAQPARGLQTADSQRTNYEMMYEGSTNSLVGTKAMPDTILTDFHRRGKWCIDGHNLQSFERIPLKQCAELCRANEKCVSFDFRDRRDKNNQMAFEYNCSLSAVRSGDVDHGLECVNGGWNYFERMKPALRATPQKYSTTALSCNGTLSSRWSQPTSG